MSSELNENELPGSPVERDGGSESPAPDGIDDRDAANDPKDFGVRDLGAPTQEIKHPVAGKPYNPDRAREWVRGGLAVGAFVLFAVFALGLAWAVAYGGKTWDDVE